MSASLMGLQVKKEIKRVKGGQLLAPCLPDAALPGSISV